MTNTKNNTSQNTFTLRELAAWALVGNPYAKIPYVLERLSDHIVQAIAITKGEPALNVRLDVKAQHGHNGPDTFTPNELAAWVLVGDPYAQVPYALRCLNDRILEAIAINNGALPPVLVQIAAKKHHGQHTR